MRRRRQAQDVEPGVGISKPWNGFPPIGPVLELASLCAGDGLTILHEPRATGAGDNVIIEHGKCRHGRGVYQNHEFLVPRSAC